MLMALHIFVLFPLIPDAVNWGKGKDALVNFFLSDADADETFRLQILNRQSED